MRILALGACLLFAADVHATLRKLAIAADAATPSEGEIELEGWLHFGRPASAGHRADASGDVTGFGPGLPLVGRMLLGINL